MQIIQIVVNPIYGNDLPFTTFLERLSKLTLEERRDQYFCGPREYKDLSEIETWQEQFMRNKKSFSEKG